ncbi:MAG TPA: hypothetical protein GXZ24_00720 [Firmicutes bacterium]|nr:hypothetical protein [Bacillota bacterium]
MEQCYLVGKQLAKHFFILSLVWYLIGPAMLLFGDLKSVGGLLFGIFWALLNYNLAAKTFQKLKDGNPAKVCLDDPMHFLVPRFYIISILPVVLYLQRPIWILAGFLSVFYYSLREFDQHVFPTNVARWKSRQPGRKGVIWKKALCG